MGTLDYYNENADLYYSSTINADVSSLYDHFEPLLPSHAKIIDIGCGSGRDSKHFLESGYDITPIDGSKELCIRAEQLLGIPVRHLLFIDLDYESIFDAAWACASLLHVPKKELPLILQKISASLKPNGVFYASFKYGNTERTVGDRLFSDYTETDLSVLTGYIPDCKLHSFWISTDVRANRLNEKWLNIIWRKVGLSV